MPRSDSDTGSTVQVPIEGFPTLQALFDHAAGLFAGNCYMNQTILATKLFLPAVRPIR